MRYSKSRFYSVCIIVTFISGCSFVIPKKEVFVDGLLVDFLTKKPLSNVEVIVYKHEDNFPMPSVVPSDSIRTSDDGKFSVSLSVNDSFEIYAKNYSASVLINYWDVHGNNKVVVKLYGVLEDSPDIKKLLENTLFELKFE